MRKLIAFFVILTSINITAQGFEIPQSFRHLKQIKIEMEIDIYAFVSNDFIENYSISEKFQEENHIEEIIGLVKPNRNSNDYYLLSFTSFPSYDHAFSFYKKENNEYNYSFSIGGKQIYLPGNGFVYVSGHSNNMFSEKRKYKLENDSLTEIKQPYYYVGLNTKTSETIAIFESQKLERKVATLPKNSEIEVVLCEYIYDKKNEFIQDEYYLIKTSFGLIGWWRLDHSYKQTINGLFYNGD